MRQKWLKKRRTIEKRIAEKKIELWNGKKISAIDMALRVFEALLKVSGLHKRGVSNALKVQFKELDLYFDQLPKAFEGYTILQLSDLHIDTLPELSPILAKIVGESPCDLCVWTGDYRRDTHGSFQHTLPYLQAIAQQINAQDGIWGILGNHDPGEIVPFLEKMGISMLVNESTLIEKNGASLLLTGTDDPHYYTETSEVSALQQTDDGSFKIALIHTAEYYQAAAKEGYDLYLCGHTHGGQIALPNGTPLITHVNAPKALAKGLWTYKGMTGYTSTGAGVSGIPIRFFTRGEVTRFTLRKKP